MRNIVAGVALLVAAPVLAQQTTRGILGSVLFPTTNVIATANVSQQVFERSGSRSYLFCQNPIGSSTTLYVTFGTPATATGNAHELAAGGSITFQGAGFMPSGAVNVMSATAGARFICEQNVTQ